MTIENNSTGPKINLIPKSTDPEIINIYEVLASMDRTMCAMSQEFDRLHNMTWDILRFAHEALIELENSKQDPNQK